MEKEYDTKLECLDWRYSAAIIGLIKYFKFYDIEIFNGVDEDGCDKDYIEYNQSDITKENFLKFAEYEFKDDMPHKAVEEILFYDEFSEEQIKLVNDKLKSNTIMKKVFGKLKFDGSNKKTILSLIDDNRQDIIFETFKNKKNLYANYCNTNLIFSENQPHCRLVGYNIDENRKSKSIAYYFNNETFVSSDRMEFDFIVFAFSNTYDAIFINNNSCIRNLVRTNQELHRLVDEEKKEKEQYGNARRALFKGIINSAEFINYDVEVIIKSREKEYYETLFIRKSAIEILRSIGDINIFSISYKVNDNYYVDIQKEVINCILNELLLDKLIEILLKPSKDKKNFSYLVRQLIDINILIKDKLGGIEGMNEKNKVAFACAKEVLKKIDDNKVSSYRNKLISAMVAHDYGRVCDIMLQLSDYSNVSFGFAYGLFEDFEKNKELAYTFINSLQKVESADKKEGK